MRAGRIVRRADAGGIARRERIAVRSNIDEDIAGWMTRARNENSRQSGLGLDRVYLHTDRVDDRSNQITQTCAAPHDDVSSESSYIDH
jgi:hypothetical protein